jgi:hypothetical protein
MIQTFLYYPFIKKFNPFSRNAPFFGMTVKSHVTPTAGGVPVAKTQTRPLSRDASFVGMTTSLCHSNGTIAPTLH